MPPKAKKKVDDDNKKRDLTDGGFTELLIRHFVGDVGAHQDADLDLQLLSDDVWDELQTLWSLIDTLEDNNKGQCGLRSYLLLTPECVNNRQQKQLITGTNAHNGFLQKELWRNV